MRNKSESFKYRHDHGPPKTHVTYNESLVIQCMDSSPYVLCHGRPSPRSDIEKDVDRTRHKPWKFAIVKKFKWQLEWDFSSCPYSNCVDDSDHLAPDTDILGFNGQHLKRGDRIVGRSNQTRVFMLWESPVYTGSSFQLGKLPWLTL